MATDCIGDWDGYWFSGTSLHFAARTLSLLAAMASSLSSSRVLWIKRSLSA